MGMGKYGLGYLAQDRDQLAGAFECGNEHSTSTKCGEFLDQLRTG